MADESVSATTVINAPAEAIFVVLADPAKHAAIDGTGWVRESLDSKPLTATGQIFRMSMDVVTADLLTCLGEGTTGHLRFAISDPHGSSSVSGPEDVPLQANATPHHLLDPC